MRSHLVLAVLLGLSTTANAQLEYPDPEADTFAPLTIPGTPHASYWLMAHIDLNPAWAWDGPATTGYVTATYANGMQSHFGFDTTFAIMPPNVGVLVPLYFSAQPPGTLVPVNLKLHVEFTRLIWSMPGTWFASFERRIYIYEYTWTGSAVF